jgi:hypothetical protein
VSAQVLTYPQNSSFDNLVRGASRKASGNPAIWCQVVDSTVFFDDASNLSDPVPGTVNQAFGVAARIFPTKLSTENVGDFKNPYGS